VREVRGQSCVEAGCGYGECGSNSLASKGHCVWSASMADVGVSHTHVRPVRITVSSVAIKSVMTESASYRPARTEMMSELGFVYFFVKAASRKAVKVWLVSHSVQSKRFDGRVPRVRLRLRGPWPA
jgi:hypothetical protein